MLCISCFTFFLCYSRVPVVGWPACGGYILCVVRVVIRCMSKEVYFLAVECNELDRK